jgi:hypothetical protein
MLDGGWLPTGKLAVQKGDQMNLHEIVILNKGFQYKFLNIVQICPFIDRIVAVFFVVVSPCIFCFLFEQIGLMWLFSTQTFLPVLQQASWISFSHSFSASLIESISWQDSSCILFPLYGSQLSKRETKWTCLRLSSWTKAQELGCGPPSATEWICR